MRISAWLPPVFAMLSLGCGGMAPMAAGGKARSGVSRAAAPALPPSREAAAAERAGDDLAWEGKLAEALAKYAEALAAAAPEAEDGLREKALKVALSMPAPPPPSEAAERHLMRAQAKFKLAAAGRYGDAMEEMRRALAAAPWWPAAYYNAALIQEAAADHAGAVASLRWYLKAAPQAEDAAEVRRRIYQLEAAGESAQKAAGASGAWQDGQGRVLQVSVAGGRLKIQTVQSNSFKTFPLSVDAVLQDGTIRGSAFVGSYRPDYCDLPAETVPVSGSLDEDGERVELSFEKTAYRTTKKWVGLLEGIYQCTGVHPSGTETVRLTLTKR